MRESVGTFTGGRFSCLCGYQAHNMDGGDGNALEPGVIHRPVTPDPDAILFHVRTKHGLNASKVAFTAKGEVMVDRE